MVMIGMPAAIDLFVCCMICHLFLVLFISLRRLCSDDSDFSSKSDEMCNFFDKRGYPASVVQAGYHRERENNDRIPFTLTTTQ